MPTRSASGACVPTWTGKSPDCRSLRLGRKQMSSVDAYPHVTVASDDDLRESIRRAEQRSGFTYAQLAEQARTGRYKSFQARLA
jgi:hypothetical protein